MHAYFKWTALLLLVVALVALPLPAQDAETPNSETPKSASPDSGDATPDTKLDLNGGEDVTPAEKTTLSSKTVVMLAGLTIFILAIFVGFEIITKVPATLHTPLMSGSNAISGITLVGAVIVAGGASFLASTLGMLAVILATINVVGGFLVTHRMLAMFKKR
ncbi:MAG: NAD(P) transhydrogenase subunit alpha [Pirellulaceae bacterium]|jgi:NAD(P) transhydrogenase subunit alpha